MKKILSILSILFLFSLAANANQTNMDIARELCVNALVEPTQENCNAAFVFGKNTLDNLDNNTEIKKVNHLKGLLCSACFNCSLNNLEKLVIISDDVIKFRHDSAHMAELHIINAWLIKSLSSIFYDELEQAISYIRIADTLLDNYKYSTIFDKEIYNRTKKMIEIQRELILKNKE